MKTYSQGKVCFYISPSQLILANLMIAFGGYAQMLGLYISYAASMYHDEAHHCQNGTAISSVFELTTVKSSGDQVSLDTGRPCSLVKFDTFSIINLYRTVISHSRAGQIVEMLAGPQD